MPTLEEIFPPYALRISAGPVSMTVQRDDDLPELVDLVRGGVHDPGLPMPFLRDWHRARYDLGSPNGFPATSLAWWWTQRATHTPQEWRLALVVRRDGEFVGMQDLHARNFLQTRRIETGSWLGLSHHGRGTGTLMRQLAVALAFDELGATSCESGYIVGNHASAAVSRKVGYRDNGRSTIVQHVDGEAIGVDEQRVIVTPDTFVRPETPITIDGAAELRRFFGLPKNRV